MVRGTIGLGTRTHAMRNQLHESPSGECSAARFRKEQPLKFSSWDRGRRTRRQVGNFYLGRVIARDAHGTRSSERRDNTQKTEEGKKSTVGLGVQQ